jgi:hypothetical protein
MCNVEILGTGICFSYGSSLKGMTANSRFRKGFRGLVETTEADDSNDYLNFLGKFESTFKTAFPHESGPKFDY